MTAEIAIINKSAVVIAADSAVTIGKRRAWQTSNKIFSLSPKNDIGVMFYGSSVLGDIPWEVILKEFRRSNFYGVFDHVSEARDAFFKFVRSNVVDSTLSSKLGLTGVIYEFVNRSNNYAKGGDSSKSFNENLSVELNEMLEKLSTTEQIQFCSYRRYLKLYKQRVLDFADEVMEEKPNQANKRTLVRASFLAFCSTRFVSGYETGVIFAGYGIKELLPVVILNIFDGKEGEICRTWQHDITDMNDYDGGGGYIIPFAQQDMTYLFIEGMLETHLDFISEVFKGVLDAKSAELVENYVPPENRLVEHTIQNRDNINLIDKILKEFEKHRRRTSVDRLLQIISSLPKEEMAAMAEAFVDLQSLRRKMDSNVQSVGGPVDVAVISKGDGFVWVKRKHYFDAALNSDFQDRRQNRRGMDYDA